MGAGIVGCSIARELKLRNPDQSVVIIEKEDRVGAHTSSRNSGVVHSGFNQKPGNLKAALCVHGSVLLKDFAKKTGVSIEELGTIVVARNDEESTTLRELQRRAQANGVPRVHILDQAGLKRVEPYAEAKEALLSPTGAIVDSAQLVATMACDAISNGVSLVCGTKVSDIVDKGEHLVVKTPTREFFVKSLVNCAGLYADEVAWMMDVGLDYCVIPFRGDYYRLAAGKNHLVNSMIYPAPNLEFPFLGIHLTKRTDGSVIVGPNAFLALGREKYRDSSINWRETLRMLFDIRFARLISNVDFLRIAMKELKISLSKKAFVEAAKQLVPSISEDDLLRDQSGMRAQLVDRKGHLVDDFVFERTDKSFHVLNAVSPAMTCSLAFADHIANLILS